MGAVGVGVWKCGNGAVSIVGVGNVVIGVEGEQARVCEDDIGEPAAGNVRLVAEKGGLSGKRRGTVRIGNRRAAGDGSGRGGLELLADRLYYVYERRLQAEK